MLLVELGASHDDPRAISSCTGPVSCLHVPVLASSCSGPVCNYFRVFVSSCSGAWVSSSSGIRVFMYRALCRYDRPSCRHRPVPVSLYSDLRCNIYMTRGVKASMHARRHGNLVVCVSAQCSLQIAKKCAIHRPQKGATQCACKNHDSKLLPCAPVPSRMRCMSKRLRSILT